MGNNRFDHGKEAIKLAKKNNCEVRNGHGDHFIIYSPDRKSSVVVVNRKMGKGLGCKAYKWFKLMGLLTLIFIIGEQILA